MTATCETPMVLVEGLQKTFLPGTVNEKTIFHDFNLSVRKHDFVSVVGSNGSGKTTLLNLLCGSVPVDGGKITIGGQDVTKYPAHRRARFIGRVFQDPAKGTCAGLTILENLSLADNKGKRFNLTPGVNRKRTQAYRDMLSQLSLGLENHMDQKVGS